jgi:hypothetical protein
MPVACAFGLVGAVRGGRSGRPFHRPRHVRNLRLFPTLWEARQTRQIPSDRRSRIGPALSAAEEICRRRLPSTEPEPTTAAFFEESKWTPFCSPPVWERACARTR